MLTIHLRRIIAIIWWICSRIAMSFLLINLAMTRYICLNIKLIDWSKRWLKIHQTAERPSHVHLSQEFTPISLVPQVGTLGSSEKETTIKLSIIIPITLPLSLMMRATRWSAGWYATLCAPMTSRWLVFRDLKTWENKIHLRQPITAEQTVMRDFNLTILIYWGL